MGKLTEMPQHEALYVGIDLAIAKKKVLPIVACRWQDDRCVPIPLRQFNLSPPRGPGNAAVLEPEAVQLFVREEKQYLSDISNRTGLPIGRIAIDAPSAPASNRVGRRSAERAMDSAGISCFTTPIEGTRVFSVPLLYQGRAIAVLTLVSLRDVLSLEDFERHIFPHLKNTANQIAVEFSRFDSPALC